MFKLSELIPSKIIIFYPVIINQNTFNLIKKLLFYINSRNLT